MADENWKNVPKVPLDEYHRQRTGTTGLIVLALVTIFSIGMLAGLAIG